MNYRPCYGCTVDRHSCIQRGSIKIAIAGWGVTSISFKCPDRVPHFKTGDRCIATLRIADVDGDLEDVEFTATVLKEAKPGKFYVFIDPGMSECGDYEAPGCLNANGYAKVSFERLAPLQEPSLKVCPACQYVEGKGGECYQSGARVPEGCLLAIAKAEGRS